MNKKKCFRKITKRKVFDAHKPAILFSGPIVSVLRNPFSLPPLPSSPSVIHIIVPRRGKKGDKQTYLSSAGFHPLNCYSSWTC